MTLPKGEEAERCRAETKARLPAFRILLAEKLPDGHVLCWPPENYELAATVNVQLVHLKGHRVVDYNSYDRATIARLSDAEKQRMAAAVGESADAAGLEVLFKPTASGPGLLVYRLFWKPGEEAKVSFCNWCPDPHNPDPAKHPGGSPRHTP